MWMISTCNEWDPLEAIVVGSTTHANWPTTDPVFAEESQRTLWKDSPVPSGPVPQLIIDQANRELDTLSETLLRLGVTVYRPQPMNFVETQGMYNYCPRDRLLVWNDIIVDVNMMYPCRDQEIQNYGRILEQARQVVTMPRDQGLVLDAANVCRLGDTWLFLESASGNRAAYEWLSAQFPQVNIELCDFYQYPYASKWIAMNMLVVNPEIVILDAAQTQLITILKKHNIDSIPLTLSHSRTLGGGFHCVTLDTRRQHA